MALLVTDTSPGGHMEETECWSSGEWSGKSCVNHLHIELAPYALRSPRKNVDYKRGELRSVLRMRTEPVRNLVQRRGSGITGWMGTANETGGKPRESYVLIRQRRMCFKKVRGVSGCQMLLWSNGPLDTSLLVGEWTSLAMTGLVWNVLFSHLNAYCLSHSERGWETALNAQFWGLTFYLSYPFLRQHLGKSCLTLSSFTFFPNPLQSGLYFHYICGCWNHNHARLFRKRV